MHHLSNLLRAPLLFSCTAPCRALLQRQESIPKDADALPFQFMVAVNKFDLLPRQATARRVEQWVRSRLRQAGLPKPDRVFMLSSVTGYGVKEMLDRLKADMGFRADLWVVGAQNGEHGAGSWVEGGRQVKGGQGCRVSKGRKRGWVFGAHDESGHHQRSVRCMLELKHWLCAKLQESRLLCLSCTKSA
jgi:hypothetical protein